MRGSAGGYGCSEPSREGTCSCETWETGDTWCDASEDNCHSCKTKKYGRGTWCPGNGNQANATAPKVYDTREYVADVIEVDHDDCPCADCPRDGHKAMCCHWTHKAPGPASACEIQNWSKKTCTPAYGTWCKAKHRPKKRCGGCADCPPSGASGACCHWTHKGHAPPGTCEVKNWTPQTCTPAYGTWCSADEIEADE